MLSCNVWELLTFCPLIMKRAPFNILPSPLLPLYMHLFRMKSIKRNQFFFNIGIYCTSISILQNTIKNLNLNCAYPNNLVSCSISHNNFPAIKLMGIHSKLNGKITLNQGFIHYLSHLQKLPRDITLNFLGRHNIIKEQFSLLPFFYILDHSSHYVLSCCNWNAWFFLEVWYRSRPILLKVFFFFPPIYLLANWYFCEVFFFFFLFLDI